ncbi:MAG TPA: hypothetical protein V6C65_02120 [Allocoleopsis sp.]
MTSQPISQPTSESTSQPSSQPSVLQLAQQGDTNAIAALINQSLQSERIWSKVSFRQGCLWIMLEGEQVPHQETMVQFIQSGIAKLNIASLRAVKLYGRRSDQEMPVWREEWVVPVRATAQPVPQPVKLAVSYAPSPIKPASSGIPLVAPTVSQCRLMSLLKVLTAVSLLVSAGSLIQLVSRGIAQGYVTTLLSQFTPFSQSLYFLGRMVASSVMLTATIAALVLLFRRQGIHLHPKHAQVAYVRLGAAFLINVGLALLLMIAVNLGLVTPHPLLILPLFITCVAGWIWSCCALARAKGYKKIWGLAGLLLLDGVVLLSLFPDRWVVRRSTK